MSANGHLRFICLLVIFIVCHCHAYPQDPGSTQYRRVNQAAANQDPSQEDINNDQVDAQQTLRQSPVHIITSPQQQRRAFQRRHSSVSQSQNTQFNGSQSLVSSAPKTQPRSTVRLTSNTLRVLPEQGRATSVGRDQGRGVPTYREQGRSVPNERMADHGRGLPGNDTRHVKLLNLTRLVMDAPTNHTRASDVPLRSEHEPGSMTRSDADRPSSRRVGGTPGRVSATDNSDVGRWNTDKPTQDKQHRAGSRIKLPNEGGIVFPGQDKGSIMNRPSFVPRLGGDEAPHCANGMTFCETAADGYPVLHLSRVLQTDAIVFRQLFGNDEVTLTNISQRIDSSEETSLCVSIEEIIYPKVGLSKEDKWLYIVNQDQYKQGVRIERCRSPDTECTFFDTFPFGYRTFCKQKYIYRKMLAVDVDGEPNTDSFKLPACCSCHIMRMDGTSSRMGFDAATQSPATKKRKRRRK